MGKTVRITESELTRIIKRVINESSELCDNGDCKGEFETKLSEAISSLDENEVNYLYVALINKIQTWVETNSLEKY